MDKDEAHVHALQTLSPAQWCEGFFLLTAGSIFLIQTFPLYIRNSLMSYGARRSTSSDYHAGLSSHLQVPHSWFRHFYILSVLSSVFWAWEYLQRGPVMLAIAKMQDSAGEGPSMKLGEIYLAWTLLALQGSRRLYESLFIFKPGSSQMSFGHWITGLAFYVAMGVSVWIEGANTILETWETPQPAQFLTPKAPFALALFFFAWMKQHECHRHLGSLEKYSLPSEGLFRYIICPHYTCECLIYVALAFIAAPSGTLLNRPILGAFVLGMVNLGVTAHSTRQWYADKFGTERVAGRWKMIPFIF